MTDAVIIALVAAGPPTLLGAAALVVSVKTKTKVQETHLLINSNLDAWKEMARKAYFAQCELAEKNRQVDP